ncbi:MAG: CAP domain-containing protein, partial [Pyrinomonadaceae bacterium]|nr:CAP domain-containing protein [Pyrinomonadaceae bacterium]
VSLGQSESPKRAANVRYISSAPRLVGEVSRPRVRYLNKGTNGLRKSDSPKDLRPTDFSLEKKAFKLINEKRAEKGLAGLEWNDKVAQLARQHSENMAQYGFFSHVGLNGRLIDERAIDFGIDDWRSIGENIAYNKGFSNPAEFAVERWMLSKGHRRNLLHTRWKEAGIGMAVTSEGMYFFTQVFVVN